MHSTRELSTAVLLSMPLLDPWLSSQMRIVKQRLKEMMPDLEVFLDVRRFAPGSY